MSDEKRTAPASAEAGKKMIIKRYNCKTGKVTEAYFSKMQNSSFDEKDVKIELGYAPIVLCSYASRGTEARDVIVTVRGSENRDVFEQMKEAVDKINCHRKHQGGERVSFHISLVGANTAPAEEEQERQEPKFVPEDSFGKHEGLNQKCKCSDIPTA